MLLVLSGTKQGEHVHILATEGDDKPFVKTKSSSFKGRIVEVVHKEKDYNGDITQTFNLRFEARGQSHYFMMKSGSLALQVINSLASATTEQLEDVELSFYVSKTGFNSVSVRAFSGNFIDKPNGDRVKEYDRLEWFIDKDKRANLVKKVMFKGKEQADNTEFVNEIIKLVALINEKAPARLVQGGGSDLFDEDIDYSSASQSGSQGNSKQDIDGNQGDNGDIPFANDEII